MPVVFQSGDYTGATICAASNPELVTGIIISQNTYTYTLVQYADQSCTKAIYTLVSTGTYTATTTAIEFIQEGLTLTPAPGESSALPCSGLTLQDSVPTSVAGLSCAGQNFNGNGSPFFLYGGYNTSTTMCLPQYPPQNIAVGEGLLPISSSNPGAGTTISTCWSVH